MEKNIMSQYEYNLAVRKMDDLAKSMELEHSDDFTGKHRGIAFKVRRHNRGGMFDRERHNVWCYYVYLCKENFTEEDWVNIYTKPTFYEFAGKTRHNYNYSYLEECDFHGGITWFEVKCDPATPDNIRIEIGCDYNHYWDEGNLDYYHIDNVLRDVKGTIEKLHSMFKFRVWSHVDGTFQPETKIAEYNKAAHEKLWPKKND